MKKLVKNKPLWYRICLLDFEKKKRKGLTLFSAQSLAKCFYLNGRSVFFLVIRVIFLRMSFHLSCFEAVLCIKNLLMKKLKEFDTSRC